MKFFLGAFFYFLIIISIVIYLLKMSYKKKIIIAYDGTEFGGWQKQPQRTTIQELLENALSHITQERIPIIGAGRTDAGVHARRQVAHFTLKKPLSDKVCIQGLNTLIPKDIRVVSAEDVPDSFHAQYGAKEKIYHYTLSTTPVPCPLQRRFALHFVHTLDLSLIQSAIERLVGTHDFCSLANVDPSSKAKSTVRTLYSIDLTERTDSLTFIFRGSGFLYKMVRNLMGLLLEVGQNRFSLDQIPALLTARDRRAAPKCVAAHGLCLHDVIYVDTPCKNELSPLQSSASS